MSGSWYRLGLDHEAVTSGAAIIIQRKCERLWIASGAPQMAALFSATNMRGADFVTLYFSPDMFELCRTALTMLELEPCEAPVAGTVIGVLTNGGADKLLCPRRN